MAKAVKITKDTKVLKSTMVVVVVDCHYMNLDLYFSSLPGALREAESWVVSAMQDVSASPATAEKAMAAWNRYVLILKEVSSIQDLSDDELAKQSWAIDIDGNLVSDLDDASYSVRITNCPLYE